MSQIKVRADLPSMAAVSSWIRVRLLGTESHEPI